MIQLKPGKLAGPAWGPIGVYFRLPPAQRAALWSGERLRFSTDPSPPDQALPADVAQQLLQDSGLAGVPGAEAIVTLHFSRSEHGQVSLELATNAHRANESVDRSPYGVQGVTAQSPSVRKPDNAAENEALRDQSPFQRVVSVKPEPSCPWFAPKGRPARDDFGIEIGGRRSYAGPDGLQEMGSMAPHVNAADVWEAVHRASGLDIVADAYTRAYPAASVTVEEAPLFDALCRIGDRLGARWKREDRFLLCRGTSYLWDRPREIANHLLARWQADRKRNGGLPLEDLLEIATLSDQQLNSFANNFVVEHCWGIEELNLVGGDQGPVYGSPGMVAPSFMRPYARFLAGLTPGQRELAVRSEGLLVADLTAAQQLDLARVILVGGLSRPQRLPELRLHVDYVPASGYLWHPAVASVKDLPEGATVIWPVVAGKSMAAVLATARRYQPAAEPGDIQPCLGALRVTFIGANGPVWEYGGPEIMLRAGP